MEIITRLAGTKLRFSIKENKVEVAHVYLYILENDRHDKPFGLIEDLSVNGSSQSGELGIALLQAAISEAKKLGCYKIIAISSFVRSLSQRCFERVGFQDHGKEIRLDI